MRIKRSIPASTMRMVFDTVQNIWYRFSPILIFIFWLLWIPQNTL